MLANPKDTKDWPKGVWTLPPTLALGDQDRAKYLAIGEADNFLLKFEKPSRQLGARGVAHEADGSFRISGPSPAPEPRARAPKEFSDERRATQWIYYAIPVVVVIGLGAALYYGRTHRQAAQQPVAAAPPAPASEAPPIMHPIARRLLEKPLPPLSESDAAVHESLSGLFGRKLEPFLVPQDIVRNVVVTIDNLPRKKTAVQRWPVKPTAGELAVSGAEELTLSEANYERYAPLVKIVQNAESHSSLRCIGDSIRCSRKRTSISAIRTAISTIGSSKSSIICSRRPKSRDQSA